MPRANAAKARPPAVEQEPLEEEQSLDADSSPASSASDLLGDPGPEYDAGQAGQDASEREDDRALSAAPGGETGIEIEWHPDTVKSMLQAQGAALHAVAGKAEQDWVYTKDELGAIAPPLTRILNRYDATRVAAGTGDELALLLGLSGHTMRSLQERKAALAVIRAEEEQAEAQAAQFGTQPPIQPQEDLIQ